MVLLSVSCFYLVLTSFLEIFTLDAPTLKLGKTKENGKKNLIKLGKHSYNSVKPIEIS